MAMLRVLVAEDAPDNQVLIRQQLEKLGADMTLAEDGRDAVDLALEAEEDEPFSIVFMDMDMPGMDGLEATRMLRARGFSGPIVALTARSSEADREASHDAGCDDHIVKPTSLGTLHAAMLRHCRIAPRRSGVLPRILVSEFAGDAEMMEIVRPFVQALPSRAEAMRAALEAGDLLTLKRLAHQLKGSAGGYGFPSITGAAARVDMSVASGQSVDTIKQRVDELSHLTLIARASMPPSSMQSEAASLAGKPTPAEDGRRSRSGS